MNIKQAKQILIQDYLLRNWFKPTKTLWGQMWYLSIFREEKTPSFKVNTNMNTRYDFWGNIGWDVIKLVRDLHSVDTSRALQMLEGWVLSIKSPPTQLVVPSSNQRKWLTLIRTDEITDSRLLEYLKYRCIAQSVYQKYLVQVHFQTSKWSKQVALGFQNDADDYEIRNKIFKGLVGRKKAITSINITNQSLIVVFEGFFDFLSYATKYRNRKIRQGYIILNSINGQLEAIEQLNYVKPQVIHFYLDNDDSGQSAFKAMKWGINVPIIENHVSEYWAYKDYSEYWMALCR